MTPADFAPAPCDALRHIEAALEALCIEGISIDARTGERTPIAPLTLSIADELERMDAAIGTKGRTGLAALADAVRTALVELAAAHRALGGRL